MLRQTARHMLGRSYGLLHAAGLYRSGLPPVAFVVENANWSTYWDGRYITDGVNGIAPGTAAITSRPERLVDRIVHFGSQYMWLTWGDTLSRRNRYVATFFHGKREDGADAARHVDEFLASVPRLETVVTAARMIERRLLDWGVPRDKLVRIPIGVDTSLFHVPDADRRQAARRQFGVPADRVCIGSFQKDGVGWGDGMEPKLIKGPDVFLEAVNAINKRRPVFVLLTGPARGYVKHGLEQMGIPYAHRFVEDYRELVSCYHALDAYLVTSREEGGPKAVMEAMATGVPIVSTAVGMAPDLIEDGVNGGLVACEDVAALTDRALLILAEDSLRQSWIARGRETVAAYDWSHVARAHYEQVYRPLLTAREAAL